MHLVITARRVDRLEKIAADLHTRHGARVEVIPGDLAELDFRNKLVREVESRRIELELVVNNAGFAVVRDVPNTGRDTVRKLVRVNIEALTDLTYAFLPGMMARGHGAVLNLSSVAAFQPVAYMAAYAASKAYILHLSEALWAEARQKGVTVTAVCPGVTDTEFYEAAGVGEWLKKQRSQSPEQVVRAALKAIDKGRQYEVPGVWNYLRSLLVRLAPRKTVAKETMKYFRPRKNKPELENEADVKQDQVDHAAGSGS